MFLQLILISAQANEVISEKNSNGSNALAKKQGDKVAILQKKLIQLEPKKDKPTDKASVNTFRDKYLTFTVSCCVGCPTLRPCQ